MVLRECIKRPARLVNYSHNVYVVRIERRKYRLRTRAEKQQQTRLRITEAAVALHSSIGPARTTVTAVAELAGVDRLTVYRHFPTQRDLFTACSAHAQAADPPPDPAAWRAIDEPTERLTLALRDLYAYYERNEQLLGNVLRDAETLPLVRELSAPRRVYLKRACAELGRGWNARGRRRTLLHAAIGHALEFTSWRSLVRHHAIGGDDAVQLMVHAVVAQRRRP